jgi:hypothetical protein
MDFKIKRPLIIFSRGAKNRKDGKKLNQILPCWLLKAWLVGSIIFCFQIIQIHSTVTFKSG